MKFHQIVFCLVAANALISCPLKKQINQCTGNNSCRNDHLCIEGYCQAIEVDVCPHTAYDFSHLSGIISDQIGNIYISDKKDCVIYKLTDKNEFSIYAGVKGFCQTIDGSILDARFSGPQILAIDSKDNIYLSDFSVNKSTGNLEYGFLLRLRKIDKSGITETIDSKTKPFFTSQNLDLQKLIEKERETNLFDRNNILKMSGIIIEPNVGTMWMTVGHAILQVSINGEVSILAGNITDAGNQDGSFDDARFSEPAGIAYYNNSLFVADLKNNAIRYLRLLDKEVVTSATASASQKKGDKILNRYREGVMSKPLFILSIPPDKIPDRILTDGFLLVEDSSTRLINFDISPTVLFGPLPYLSPNDQISESSAFINSKKANKQITAMTYDSKNGALYFIDTSRSIRKFDMRDRAYLSTPVGNMLQNGEQCKDK